MWTRQPSLPSPVIVRLRRAAFSTVNRTLESVNLKLSLRNDPGHLGGYPCTSRPAEPRFVNIGAGAFRHPYWHNLDTPNEFYHRNRVSGIHIIHDLSRDRTLPLKGNSVRVFYCSHVIEHLSNADAQALFHEVHRCLEPDGHFRLVFPDIKIAYRAFVDGVTEFWGNPTPWGTKNATGPQAFLEYFATALSRLPPSNRTTLLDDTEICELFQRNGLAVALQTLVDLIPGQASDNHAEDHRNWFTVDKVRDMLEAAGFATIEESRYRQSSCRLLLAPVFDCTSPEVSAYVDCRR